MNSKIVDFVLTYLEENSFQIVNNPEIFYADTELDIIDSNGYKYYSTTAQIYTTIKRGGFIKNIHPSNCYALYNIQNWIWLNNSSFTLIDGEYVNQVTKNLLLKCNTCNNEWHTCWNYILSGLSCPYCSSKRVSDENSFLINFPDVAKDWDYEKNYPVLPENIVFSSHKIVSWKCNVCGYKWDAPVRNRTERKSRCPYCAERIPTKERNFAKNYPDLAEEWDYNSNIKLPNEYTPNSNAVVYWKCSKCTLIWKTTINDRSNGSGCPYCAGKKASKNNNFAKSYPHIAIEWDYEKNDKFPDEYTPKSNKSVYWICHQCGHSWKVKIYKRATGRGCPCCKMSSGAKEIYYFLEKNNISFYTEYEFNDLLSDLGNCLRYDFCIVDENDNIVCLIEFDGEQHTTFIEYIHKTIERFKRLQYHDQLKNEYAENNGIPLLRFTKENIDTLDIILNYI